MSNVIGLVKLEVNEDALELARDLVSQIERGEVIACAFVAVRRARTVATAISKSDAYHEMNSGAARLAAMLANDPGEPD